MRNGGNPLEEKEGMSILAECEDCKTRFEVSGTNGVLYSCQRFDCDGKIIFITYYVCPNCGKKHYCQIDDTKTLELLKDATRQFKKLSLLVNSNKSVPRKQNDRFKKARRHLDVARKKLMDEYTNKTVTEVSIDEVVEELKFSV